MTCAHLCRKLNELPIPALFYMHRGFFAQALEDSPVDPMGSKYSPSVLAAYSSATSFVGLVESLYNQHPQLTERMWFLFTHVFSCAVSNAFSAWRVPAKYPADRLGLHFPKITNGALALSAVASGLGVPFVHKSHRPCPRRKNIGMYSLYPPAALG